MSAAEIADNKWELSATKAPIGDAASIAQLILMSAFALLFLGIAVFSVIAIVGPKAEGSLAEDYSKMKADDEVAPVSAD